jgi:hypothetical protein
MLPSTANGSPTSLRFLLRSLSQAAIRTFSHWITLSRWLGLRKQRVSDNGRGVPAAEVQQLFFAERPRAHALVLLRRRLQGLFGGPFQLAVRSGRRKGHHGHDAHSAPNQSVVGESSGFCCSRCGHPDRAQSGRLRELQQKPELSPTARENSPAAVCRRRS